LFDLGASNCGELGGEGTSGKACCNTCQDGEPAICVDCLGENRYNFAYDNCADFLASNNECCSGLECRETEGGVECVDTP